MGHHHKQVPDEGKVQAASEPSTTNNPAAFTEANRRFFDNKAAAYNDPAWVQNLTQTITTDLLSNLAWFDIPFLYPSEPDAGRQFRIMDYACGPGLITSIFRPYASEILGVDLSEKMVERYNTTYSLTFPKQEEPPPGAICHAVVGDLFTQPRPSDSLDGPDYFDLDVVVVSAAMHHFPDLQLAAERFVERLRPGGSLVVVDFVEWKEGTGGQAEKDAAHTIAHKGFSEAGLKALFEGVGLEGFAWRVLEKSVTVEFGGHHAHGEAHEGHEHKTPAEAKKHEDVEKWICVVKGRKPEV